MQIIYCAAGNRRFMSIARKYKMLPGAQLPGTLYDCHLPLYFADQDFKRPRYIKYIKYLRKYRPVMASVLDIEEWRRFDEYIMRAEEISQYCQIVMLIPKVTGVIAELERQFPDKKLKDTSIRLGYSVQTGYGGTDVPVKEFGDWPVHLLGGSPEKQMEKISELNVVSMDGNYIQKMTRFCQFFYPESMWTDKYRDKAKKVKRKTWPTVLEFFGERQEKNANYLAFEISCKNLTEYFRCALKE